MFAFVSLLDGFKWDDPYPGYGEVARRRDARREEYHDRKHIWLESLAVRREQARAEVGELRHDIDMMQGEIMQASIGRAEFYSRVQCPCLTSGDGRKSIDRHVSRGQQAREKVSSTFVFWRTVAAPKDGSPGPQ